MDSNCFSPSAICDRIFVSNPVIQKLLAYGIVLALSPFIVIGTASILVSLNKAQNETFQTYKKRRC